MPGHVLSLPPPDAHGAAGGRTHAAQTPFQGVSPCRRGPSGRSRSPPVAGLGRAERHRDPDPDADADAGSHTNADTCPGPCPRPAATCSDPDRLQERAPLREAPGFWQRFSGALSDDGGSIRGAWEKSADGSSWERDFDLIFTRAE